MSCSSSAAKPERLPETRASRVGGVRAGKGEELAGGACGQRREEAREMEVDVNYRRGVAPSVGIVVFRGILLRVREQRGC